MSDVRRRALRASLLVFVLAPASLAQRLQAPGYVVRYCPPAIVIQLDRDMNVNQRRGTEATPELGSPRTIRGIRLPPLSDLIRMKLTSFRLRDEMHVKDLDNARLISPEIEARLPPILKERLAQTRARD